MTGANWFPESLNVGGRVETVIDQFRKGAQHDLSKRTSDLVVWFAEINQSRSMNRPGYLELLLAPNT